MHRTSQWRRLNAAMAVAVTLSLAYGCESNPSSPATPVDDVQPSGELPPPNPAGVLLEGDAASNAVAAVADLPPSPTAAAEIEDGLLTTRLLALIDPDASVTQVNETLEAMGARIVSMRDSSPFVTLKIPAVADRIGAEAAANAIRNGGGFAYVAPAFGVPIEPIPRRAQGRALPPSGATTEVAHLLAQGFPAAWNAIRLAELNQEQITVLVPDEYASSAPHTEIDAQGMSGYGAPNPLPGPQMYPGNQGFVVSGIIGANFDDTPITGTSPSPVELLDIVSLPIGGLTWFDLFNMLSWELAGSGDRFVLNTGLVYNDDTFATWSRFDRALHALAWRVAAAWHYANFVHVTSAGAAANPDLTSPFMASSRFDDIRDIVDLDTLSPADSLAIESAWATVTAAIPGTSTAAPNVLVVAPATAAGALLAGSAGGDVSAVGESVHGPCVSADPGAAPGFLCDGEIAVYSGGGVAAAQVSGLAAYMLSLTDRTAAEVRDRIVSTGASSSNGLIDAYGAARSLDGPDLDVHRAILDVAGVEVEPGHNDHFDENDIQVYLTALSLGGVVRGGGGAAYDRYDLNGDGITHPSLERAFDVDGDGAIGMATIALTEGTVEINESAARDVDVLCYYAYSDLYEGDLDTRDSLLPLQHSEAFVDVSFPEVIEPGVPTNITVRTGINTGGTISYVADVEVNVSVSDGDVAQEEGITDGAGTYVTTITLHQDENDVEVRIAARFPSGEIVFLEFRARRPNAIVFTGRESETQVWVSASQRANQGDPGTVLYDHGEEVDLEDFTGGYQYDLTDEDSSSGPLGYSGSARARQNSDVSVVDGDQLTGAFLSIDVNGTATILGDPDLYGYQSWASSNIQFEVDFEVWGESAAYTLTGTISTPRYDIRFYNLECSDDDAPCSSIGENGELPPDQGYRLSVRIHQYAVIQQDCGDDDPFCSTSGSVNYDGSLTVNLDVSHPSGREMGPREPITRRYH